MAEALTVTGTILSIDPRDVVARGKQTKVFDVNFSDGRTYGTFITDIANKAQGVIGQPVTLEYTIRRSGDYENYTLQGVELAQNGSQASTGATESHTNTSSGSQAGPNPQNGSYGLDKEARIMRGNALNATGALLGPLVASGHFHDGDGKVDAPRLVAAVNGLVDDFVGVLTGIYVPAEQAKSTDSRLPF